MTPNPIRRPGLLILSLVLPLSTIRAEEPDLRELLRDALFTEEVARDPEKAAKQYEELLARHDAQKTFAAAALFRLAEVRRKQDRKDDAIQLYQRLLAEFPNAETEIKLARENLVTLGAKPQAAKGPVSDAEAAEIARLEGLVKSAPDLILDPSTLESAVGNGWTKAVAYLLTKGSQPYAGDALSIAAKEGYLEIVRQLTAGEAPVPAEVATNCIEEAIRFKRVTIFEFLLQRGVKPGEIAGKSALAYALLNGSPQCAEILLQHGADLDAISGTPNPSTGSEGTALQRVIAEGDFDAANWLLDKGAKPDSPSRGPGITPLHEIVLRESSGSLPLMQRLLEAGADPNRRTKESDFHDGGRSLLSNATPLAIAVRRQDSTEKVRLLLKHGADPKSDGQLIPLLIGIGNRGTNMECVKLLVDAGARPDEGWMKDTMNRPGEVRDFLVEKFTIPGFANDAEIQLVIDDPSGIRNAGIAVRSGEASPPDLEAWLLSNHQGLSWVKSSNIPLMNYQWLIWRKGEDGVRTRQELDFSGSAALPPLQWGDVVHCRITSQSGSRGYSQDFGLPTEVLAALRKRIAFPINFEIDGTSREITVRGDRIFFDPTKDEIPLLNLGDAVRFLWQPGFYVNPAPIIHLKRTGWPDVRLSCDSTEAGKFRLEAGDRVSLEISDEIRANLTEKRREKVILKADGHPFAKSFGTDADGVPVAASVPTLIQALVDTQVPWHPGWMGLAKSKTLDPATLSAENSLFSYFSLLPHPDLASIRIRRLLEDGEEKVIAVNLAEIIAAATDPTTPEEARKADVMLQRGDVVEVPLLKDRLNEPWKGFTAREEAFFAKALGGRVQLTDEGGNMTVRDLVFQAPRFQETGRGWIPLPPENGIPCLRGSWLTGSGRMNLQRGDREPENGNSSEIFLRDGDEVKTSNARPRVVPSPSSR